MKEKKIFCSDKDVSRVEFLKRILLLFAAIIAAHYILNLKYYQRDNNLILHRSWIFEIIIGTLVLIWVLTSKITKEILIDFEKKIITISYMTIIHDINNIEIDFTSLSYTFQKTPTRYNAKKWTLKILNNNRKSLSIGTNENGFSQETLEELAMELKEITQN